MQAWGSHSVVPWLGSSFLPRAGGHHKASWVPKLSEPFWGNHLHLGQLPFVFVLSDLPTRWWVLSSAVMSELCQGSRWEKPENVEHLDP